MTFVPSNVSNLVCIKLLKDVHFKSKFIFYTRIIDFFIIKQLGKIVDCLLLLLFIYFHDLSTVMQSGVVNVNLKYINSASDS